MTSVPCDRCVDGEPCGSCLNQRHVTVDPLTPDEAFLYVCAVRYAINRQTYAGGIVIQELQKAIPRLPYSDRKLLEKEIADALFKGEVDSVYRAQWEDVVEQLRQTEGM